jgi:hypothetical protein
MEKIDFIEKLLHQKKLSNQQRERIIDLAMK